MADKITISADLDTKEVEKKLNDLAKKIKNMRELGPGGGVSQLSDQYRNSGQEERARRLEEFRERASAQNRKMMLKDLETQEKELEKQVKRYEKISELQKNLTEGGKAYEKSLEKQADALGQINKLTKDISAGRQAMGTGSFTPEYGSGFGPFSGRDVEFMRRGMGGGRGIRGGVAAMGRTVMRNPMMMAGLIGGTLNFAGSALQTGGNLAYQIGTRGERQTGAQAGISTGLSELAELQANRRGYEMQLYGPERLRAMERASNRRVFSEARDITGTAGSILQSTGTGALTGAGIGATVGGIAGGLLGSVVPGAGTLAGAGVGTAFGAKAGGFIGGVFGAGKGISGTLMDDTRRSMIFERDFYDQIKTQEQFQTYQEQVELEKAKSFEKRQAQEFFENNAGRFRGLQRGFGLSDEDLFLGPESIFQRGARAGFNTDTITQSMQDISAGGGTSRTSREGGIMAAELARDMNLTNAGQVMGRVSGATGGGAMEAKDELIRMYAEATRVGLDSSEFSKETRAFIDTASSMAYESGADFRTVSSMLGQGIGVQSERGIQASQNALQQLQQQTGQMGGLTGQYQIGELQSEELTQALGGQALNLQETAMLSGMDSSRVSLEDDYIKTILQRRGITDKDQQAKVVEQIRRGKTRSTLRTEDQEKALQDYQALLQDPNASEEDLREAESRVRELGALTGGESETRRGILEQKASARMKAGELAGVGVRENQARTDYVRANVEAAGSDSMADKREGAQAMDDLAQLNRLAKNSSALGTAFDNTTEQSVKLAEAIAKLAENVDKSEKVFGSYAEKVKQILESPGQNSGYVDINNIRSVIPNFGSSGK